MISKLKKLFKNTAGNIAITTGILAVPLFTIAGIAVDYSNFSNMRNSVQSALDASGLATGVEFTQGEKDEDVLELYAEKFFVANVGNSVQKANYDFDFELLGSDDDEEEEGNEEGATEESSNENEDENSTADTRLLIKATVKYTPYFRRFIGVEEMTEELISIISLGNRTIEVALVLDNSGSMAFEAGTAGGSVAPEDQRRMKVLKDASKALVQKLFDVTKDSGVDNPAQFSIVPFAGTVNVGPIDHENHSEDNFLDTRGYASYHNENLDWLNSYRTKAGESVRAEFNRAAILSKNDGTEQHLTRLDVFPMLGTTWEGCVEMRPWPHNVLDTYESNTSAFNSNDSEKLFVPYMVPDAPDFEYFDYFRNDRNWRGRRLSTGRIQTATDWNGGSFNPSYVTDFYDYNADNNTRFAVYQRDDEFGPGDSLGQINENQINRTNWLWKYQSVQALPDSQKPNFEKDIDTLSSRYFDDFGPNAYCPNSTILQLTDQQTIIDQHLDGMEAHGSTNIQQGLTWGWRTLSNAMPFSTGRPLSETNNLKILILLTDGNNQQLTQSSANNTQYSAWGYQRDENVLRHPISNENTHGRLLEGTRGEDRGDTIYETTYTLDRTPDTRGEFEDLMNLHTNQACNNIKDDGISIYAIAFDVPDGGKVRSLLENCSGSGRINNIEVVRNVKFYHDVTGLELEDTFQKIAEGISNLRVSQ